MIIQVRGTSGSGKTWAVKRVMEGTDWQAVSAPGRKRPLYYRTAAGSDWPPTVVLGHYESACGGCDTIGSAAAVAALTTRLRAEHPGAVIIQEGLLLSEDVKWTRDMGDVFCLFLATPVDKCLEQVRGRRAAAGNDKPLKEDNTRNRVGVIDRARVKLTEAGVRCRRVSAAQAPGVIMDLLRRAARRQEGANGSGTELAYDPDRG